MKKIVTILCVAALMACMTGCGCGTMEDDGGTSVENTTEQRTTEERTTEERTTEERTTEERTTEERTTEHSEGVLNDIGEGIEQGVDDIVGTTEESSMQR